MNKTEWKQFILPQIISSIPTFFLILFVILSIIVILPLKNGQDAQVFCAAARAAAAGKNPYDVKDLGINLSWNYQPYLLSFFQVVCPFPVNLQGSYPFLYTLLLIGGIAIWKLKSDWLLALLLAFGGFLGFGWTLISGNITAIEFFLISVAVVLIDKHRWEMAGLVLSIVAGFKLLTVAYLVLLLFIPESNSRRLRVFSLSIFLFILTFGISFVLYPHLMRPFLDQVLGLIPNQHNVWMEDESKYNLPLALFLTNALGSGGINLSFLFSSVIVILMIALPSFWPYSTFNMMDFSKRNFTDFFCLGVLGITLILPRLKPYSFLLIIPPLFYLIRLQGKGRQTLVLAVSIFIPIICFFVKPFLIADNDIPFLMITYAPTISLLAVFAILLYFLVHPREFAHA